MALSHAQLQTAAYLAQEVYNRQPDWLVERVEGVVYLSIEGTDNLVDWRRNVEFIITSDDQHLGFKNYGCRLMAEMLSCGVSFSRSDQLVITGHSLGGAVATSIAAALQDHMPNLQLVTFGSPRPGGRKFRDRLRVPHRRYVHGLDVVPRLPLAAFGFRHTAPAIVLPEPNDSILHGVADHDMAIYRRLVA